MNTMRKVFYSVVLPRSRERTIIDAIRLFARPATRHPAHVTIGGPYPDYIDPRQLSAAVRGLHALVQGVDEFKNKDKVAVFLRVHSPAMQALKHTPDYPDSPTHLSLYDGESVGFAGRLKELMQSRNPRFEFVAKDVEPMVSGNGEFPLRALYEPDDLKDFMHTPPSSAEVDSADETTRLRWIEELVSHFAAS